MNFWNEIKKSHDAEALRDKPILCLAPMADVTDVAFRHIIAKYSKVSAEKVSPSAGFADFFSKNTASVETFSAYPYVTYTEFVSADGLVKAPEIGRQKLLKDLEYSEIERPIVAQFFTSKPEMMEKAAELAVELGFDGVDINMGCPDKSIEKQGAGASLMKNPKLAREIIAAAKRGTKNKIPVSVKTRIGYHRDELETWLPEILAENPAVVVLHARTRKEMSKVPARWEHVKRAVEIRNELKSQTLIIGNGDVLDVNDAYEKCAETGADGAMLGRAVFGNPWLFADVLPTPKERLRVLAEHITLFDEKLGGFKSFALMKKHFKEYLNPSADGLSLRDFRYKLMRTENAKEAVQLVKDFLILYN